MWSDTFVQCFVKQKEDSVCIITVTVCPPENKKSPVLYTHDLAMGKSSEDHTKVINFYLAQIMELKKGFVCYFGGMNTIEHVTFSMVVWNGMQTDLKGK